MGNIISKNNKDKKIRNTISLCPLTYKEVPASIIERDKKIYMIKKDDKGDDIETLIENNNEFYKITHEDSYMSGEYKKIVYDITGRCNLNCPICYRDNKIYCREPSLEEIKKFASAFSDKLILLSGGEPTVREDLPEIIKIFSDKTKVILSTNGIMLADFDYLKLLKKNGLEFVLFAFNGFDDDVYKLINGKQLLSIKNKALENLKKLKINTFLSFLLVKEVNESQIMKSLEYYIENRDFIRELRIRSMAYVGRFIDKRRYSLSEIVDLLAQLLHIDKDVLLREVYFNQKVNRLLKKRAFVVGSCSIDFHFKVVKGKLIPFGNFLDNERLKKKWGYMYVITKLIQLYGINSLFSAGKKIFSYSSKPCFYQNDIVKIGLRSWPDKNNVDLCEGCLTAAFDDQGKLRPFCHANIKKEKKSELL